LGFYLQKNRLWVEKEILMSTICRKEGDQRMPLEINELDSKILKNLLSDGRRGYDELAKE